MLLLISFPFSLFAQNKTITGTVRDAVDVVIGASVMVKGILVLVLLLTWMVNLLSLCQLLQRNWSFRLSVMITKQW